MAGSAAAASDSHLRASVVRPYLHNGVFVCAETCIRTQCAPRRPCCLSRWRRSSLICRTDAKSPISPPHRRFGASSGVSDGDADRRGLFGLLRADMLAKAEWLYGSRTGRALMKTAVTDGTLAMVLYRLMQASQRIGLSPLAMVFNKLNVIMGGCIIGRQAEFGAGFVLIHSNGVVINSAVKGGRDVKVEHQVTIGADRGVSPILGDDVFIGAGAKILGAIRVGSRVRVGANAVVVKDVPDDMTAVGVPARYLPRKAEG